MRNVKINRFTAPLQSSAKPDRSGQWTRGSK